MNTWTITGMWLTAALSAACQTSRAGEPTAPSASGPSASAPAPQAQPPRRELPEPAYLPPAARAILSDQMQRHGDDMSDLLWAVVFLDHETVIELAKVIEDEPRFARPLEADASELNARLPPAFFEVQDELLARTRELGAAAQADDDRKISEAYAGLAKTCVDCHVAYLSQGQRLTKEEAP